MTRAVAMIAVVLTLAGGVAGCRRSGAPRASPPGPSCVPAITATAAGPVVARAAAADADLLPDLVLACLDGGQPVRLAGLGAPAVINLWASWCGPCRQELPAFQRYVERMDGRVRVLGVATNDSAPAARSLAADLHLTFPMLSDDQGRLLAAVGRSALPVTLFVDAQGRVSHVYQAQALDEPALELMAERYLGVVAH